jgi:uncharacterized protein (TIGR02145 family)
VNITINGLSDVDGNLYNTVVIGSQCWMKENLRTSKYRNSNSITNASDSAAWVTNTTGAWCYYENSAGYNATYGKLYNWYAVDNSSILCPTGWHVPSDAEWCTLSTFLDASADCSSNYIESTIAGGKLKETGTSHWNPNVGATNSSGFTALPGGCRYGNALSFVSVGLTGAWWSSTAATLAYKRLLSHTQSDIFRDMSNKNYGYSVRCLKD